MKKGNKNLLKKAATPSELKDIYGLEPGTLANLRSKKQDPTYYKKNRKVIYFLNDVEDWLKQNSVLTTVCLDSTRYIFLFY